MKREEYYEEIEKFLAESGTGEMLFPRELTAELADRLAKLSLPPAEGAEEILKDAMIFFPEGGRYVTDDANVKYYRIDIACKAIRIAQEGATLHAQRIADKMVSERLSQHNAQFKDRPNPQDVNPYDSKAIKRTRK